MNEGDVLSPCFCVRPSFPGIRDFYVSHFFGTVQTTPLPGIVPHRYLKLGFLIPISVSHHTYHILLSYVCEFASETDVAWISNRIFLSPEPVLVPLCFAVMVSNSTTVEDTWGPYMKRWLWNCHVKCKLICEYRLTLCYTPVIDCVCVVKVASLQII